MNLNAVEQSKQRLAKAEKAFQAMKTAKTLDDTEEAWTDFLVAASAIYSKLGEGAKGNSKSKAWFDKKKAERRNDPLLHYLHRARNSNEHGIKRVVTTTGPNHDLTGRELGVNERIPTEAEFFNPDTLEATSERIKGVLAGPTLKPIRAHDSRFNDYCDPPTSHLGKPIEFAEFSDSLAEAVLPYLRALVKEAEALLPAPL